MQIRTFTKEQLQRLTTPQAVAGGQVQAYPFTLFDTAAVANGDTEARFFTVNRADNYDTNLPTPGSGQLPSGVWFAIESIHFTVLNGYANAADPSAWSDVLELTSAQPSVLELEIQSKTYGPWPILQAQALGGITGGANEMADATATSQAYANNGVPGGPGIVLAQSIFLLPNASFGVRARYQSAVTLSATTDVQLAMKGVIYRPVT